MSTFHVRIKEGYKPNIKDRWVQDVFCSKYVGIDDRGGWSTYAEAATHITEPCEEVVEEV